MNGSFLFRHGWVLFIVAAIANALVVKFRSRNFICEKPELASGYNRLVRGILIWSSLPWLVMGIGIEFGGVPGFFSYFRPRDGNPYVLAWFATVFVIWILGFRWLFFRGGAQFLVEHPGLLRGDPKSPAMIRAFYCLMVLGGITAVTIIFVADIPQFPK